MKRIGKKLASLFLSLALLLGLLPAITLPVFADTQVSDESALKNALESSNTATVKLTGDIITSSEIAVKGTKTLDLNGHGIRFTGTGSVLYLTGTGSSLTLTDSQATIVHYITLDNTTYRGTSVSESGTESATCIKVNGGYITGGYARATVPDTQNTEVDGGGGIKACNGASFTMKGGTIIGNYSLGRGGGVYAKDCEFIMSGGEIKYNHANSRGTGNWGGGVCVDASSTTACTFTMSGGTISHNLAGYGGGVCVDAPFTTANCTFTMSGGTISHNLAGYGGGVLVRGSGSTNNTFSAAFIMNGGNICDNTVNKSDGYGGGVALRAQGQLKIQGNSVIQGNKNTTSNANDNLYILQGSIDVIGTMNNTVGITMKTPGVFTSSTNTTYNVAEKFISDSTSYKVQKNSNNQLELTSVGYAVTWAPSNLSVSAGSATISSGALVRSGETVTVAPGSGYVITDITATRNGGTVSVTPGANNTYSFTMPSEAVTITATVKAVKTVTYSAPTGGTLQVRQDGNNIVSGGNAIVGETVTVTATPDSGYILDTLTVKQGNNTVTTTGVGGTVSFTMPNGDVTVAATMIRASGLTAVSEKMTVPVLTGSTTTYTYTINTTVDGAAADMGRITIDGQTVMGNGSGNYTYIATKNNLTTATVAGEAVTLGTLSANASTTNVNFTAVTVTVTGYNPQSVTLSGNGPALALVESNDGSKTYTYRSAYKANGTTGSYDVLVDGVDTDVDASYGNTAQVNYKTVTVNVTSNLDVASVTLKSTNAALPMENTEGKTFALTRLADSAATPTSYTVYVNGEETEKAADFSADHTIEVAYNRYTYSVTVRLDGTPADVGIVPTLGESPMLSRGSGAYELITETGEAKPVTMAGEPAINSLSPSSDGVVNYYTLTYNAGGGTGNVPAASVHLSSTKATLAACTLTNGAQVFAGWSIGGTVYQPGDEVTVTATTTATATWGSQALTNENTTVLLSPVEFIYDGTAKMPTVTVYCNGTELTENTHYTVSFENNINAGTATVTITGKGDYAGSVEGGSFEIKPRPVQVTGVTAVNRANDGTNAVKLNTGSATLSGKVDGDDLSVTGLPETGTSDSSTVGDGWAVHIDAAGASLAGASEGNYVLAGIAGAEVNITPSALTITAKDAKRAYGMADPELPYDVLGLFNGDKAEDVLSGTLSTTATQYSPVGSGYDITQGDLTAANYTMNFTGAKLEIIKASQSAPEKGKGYTVNGTTLTLDTVSTNSEAHNETHYQIYDGETTYTTGSVTIVEGKTYYIRWGGNENYNASPYTPVILSKVAVTAAASPASMGTAELTPAGREYEIGTSLTATATVKDDSRYKFVAWQDANGEQLSTNAEYTFTVTGNRTLTAIFAEKDKTVAALPTVTNHTYDGEVKTGVSGGSNCVLSGGTAATNAGTYTATAKLDDNCVWPDGTTADLKLTWKIDKATQTKPDVTYDDSKGFTIPSDKPVEYSTDGGRTWTDVDTDNPPTGTDGTTYYFRYKGNENSSPSPAAIVKIKVPPTVTTIGVSALTSTEATLNGTISATDSVTAVGFQYKKSSESTWMDAKVDTVGKPFNATVTGLTADTDYVFRAVATKITQLEGNEVRFHTPKAAPTATGKIDVSVTSESTRNVVVSIEEGNDVISAKGISNIGTGSVTFNSLPDGYYNVVVRTTDGDYTETRMIEIQNGAAVATVFYIPVGKLATVVEVEGADTPKVAVEGLNEILTTDDRNKAAAGSEDVEVKLEVEKKEEDKLPLSSEELTGLRALVPGTSRIDAYLDMSLFKTTTTLDAEGNATSIQTEDIGSINDRVVEIAIPYADAKTKTIGMVRFHSGAAQALTALLTKPMSGFTDGTFYVDKPGGYIFLYASGFSTYAISTPKPAPAPTDSGTGGTPVYPPMTYPPIIPNTPHGGVEVSPTAPKKNDTVTITPKPDDGYEVDTVTVTDPGGKPVPVTENPDGTYTFKQPEGKVTVKVTYRPSAPNSHSYAGCPKDDTCPIWPFTDAETTEWYHDGVHYCLDERIMNGMGGGIFAPNGTTTRAMMAQIFYNMEGRPETDYELAYTDVGGNKWYADAVRWATQEGVMEGYGQGRFGPEDPITREQIITIVYRYAQYKGRSVTETDDLAGYTDAELVSAWALDAVRWSVGIRAVLGRTDTTLNPKDNATRAEIATIIMRYCTEIAK